MFRSNLACACYIAYNPNEKDMIQIFMCIGSKNYLKREMNIYWYNQSDDENLHGTMINMNCFECFHCVWYI